MGQASRARPGGVLWLSAAFAIRIRKGSPFRQSAAFRSERQMTPLEKGLLAVAGLEQFMAEMRRGIVYSTSERGIGEDEGRFRLSFRYRDRVFGLIVTTTGEIVSEESF